MSDETRGITEGTEVHVLGADGAWHRDFVAEGPPVMGHRFMVVWAYPKGRPADAMPWPLEFNGEPAVRLAGAPDA
jgi:hypothetical protein